MSQNMFHYVDQVVKYFVRSCSTFMNPRNDQQKITEEDGNHTEQFDADFHQDVTEASTIVVVVEK